jgi:3-methyladenine DNA glycosylase AlkD
LRHAPDADLVTDLRAALRRHAEPARARQMQAYMKSAMPFLGVRVPEVRRLATNASLARPFVALAPMTATIRTLWDDAAFREERYAATALCNTRSARTLRSPELLGLYRDLIVAGAWWDHVDELAHRVGELLSRWPEEIRPVVESWTSSEDIWLRRVSIICQLGAKAETDLDLLTRAIEASTGEREFFLRKAIGWALREYARTDPQWVQRFVADHELSALSRREALKHLA